MPGAQWTRSLACDKIKAHERSHHGHTGITRHSPRNGFTAYFALSPAIGLVCHRRLAVRPTGLRRPQDSAIVFGAPASTASRPTLMTCATPLSWDGTARISELIWLRRGRKYFCKGGWRAGLANSPSGKSAGLSAVAEREGSRRKRTSQTT